MYKINANSPAIQALEKFVYYSAKMKIQDDFPKSSMIQSRFHKDLEEVPAEQ